VVADGDTETDEPVPTTVPPHDPEYHFQDAAVPSVPPLMERDDEPPELIADGLAEVELAEVEF